MLEIGSQINEVRVDGDLRALKRDLDYFRSIGLEAVEIPPHGLDAIQNGRLHEGRIKTICSILRDYPFVYTVHAPNPLNLMDTQRGHIHLNVFRASLAFTKTIGAKVMVYHAGRYLPEEAFHFPPGKTISRQAQKDMMTREADLLKVLADEYPDVVICIENARPYRELSPYCYGEYLDQLASQVRNVGNDNVRITLDCGHLFMAARYHGYDPVAAVRRAAMLIAHCHIHDNYGDAVYYNEKQQTHQIPFGKGDSHMPVGWGAIPLEEILDAFLQHYRGCWIMELRSRYFEKTAESRDNLQKRLARLPTARHCL